jgi:hypothetical protein
MVYLALFLAVIAVILGGLGTKAYYDIDHNPDEDHEVGNITVNGDITLNGDGKIVHEGEVTTAVDGDLAAYTTVTKYNLVHGGLIKYRVVLNLSGLTPNATNGDIFGLDGAASTVVNLPDDFVVTNGQIRCSTATGSTAALNVIMGSTDNEAEDAVPTTGTFVQCYTNIDANSASADFEPFETVPLEAAPVTYRYLYLTTNGTGNGTTAYTAGQLVIDLVGYTNDNSVVTAVPMPLNRRALMPGRSLITTTTLSENDSGTTFFLDLVSGFTVTLPAVAAGLHFKFVVGTSPTSNGYIISTPANITIGGFGTAEVADAGACAYSATGDTITLVANEAVVGDWVEFYCDGTNYFLSGHTNVQNGATIA